jgi:hypothetical protein
MEFQDMPFIRFSSLRQTNSKHKPRKIKNTSYVDKLCVNNKVRAYAEIAEDTDDIMALWLKVEDYHFAEHVGQANCCYTYGDHFAITDFTSEQVEWLAGFMLALIIEGVAGGRRAQVLETRHAFDTFADLIKGGSGQL